MRILTPRPVAARRADEVTSGAPVALDSAILRESLELLRPNFAKLAERFCRKLLLDHSELRLLFAETHLPELQQKLMSALVLVARSIDEPRQLAGYLRQLGAEHHRRGIRSEHYAPFLSTLLEVLDEFAARSRWREDMVPAWQRTLREVSRLMQDGARSSSRHWRIDDEHEPHREKPSEETSAMLVAGPHTAVHGREDLSNFARFAVAGIASPEEPYFAMVEHSPLMQFLVNPEGRIDYVNRTGQKAIHRLQPLLGISPDEFTGGAVSQLYPRISGLCEAVAAGAPANLRARLGNDEFEIQVIPIENRQGEPIGTLHCWNVVTETAQRLDALEESLAHRERVIGHLNEQQNELEVQLGSACQALSSLAVTLQSGVASSASSGADMLVRIRSESSAASEIQGVLHTVAAKSASLKRAIHETARHAQDLLRTSAGAARRGELALAALEGLASVGVEIDQVVRKADALMQQANLLSLNAAIEAARAGEAGHGFAALARELKDLSQQTACATRDLGRHVELLQVSLGATATTLSDQNAAIAVLQKNSETLAASSDRQSTIASEMSQHLVAVRQNAGETSREMAALLDEGDQSTRRNAELVAGAKALATETNRLRQILRQQIDCNIP